VAYKAVIFDLDGTLVDTLADLSNSMNFALESLGQPQQSLGASQRMIGNGVGTFAKRALSAGKQDLADELALRMRRHYFDNCLLQSRLYDGVAEMVAKLRKNGARLAIVTNKPQNAAERIVEHFWLGPTFEYVVGEDGNTPVKPDITGTMKVVRSMALQCSDFLFVGDSKVDIETAKEANIRSVGVSWGFCGKNELAAARAHVIIDRPDELLNLPA
jgi:phosphoglycolate phosphatase